MLQVPESAYCYLRSGVRKRLLKGCHDLLAVALSGDKAALFKESAEIAGIIKAASGCDLRDGDIGPQEQAHGDLQPEVREPEDGGFPCNELEYTAEMKFADAAYRCQLLYKDLLREILPHFIQCGLDNVIILEDFFPGKRRIQLLEAVLQQLTEESVKNAPQTKGIS